MKLFIKFLIAIAAFLVIATLSTIMFFYDSLPTQKELDTEIHQEQTPLGRVMEIQAFKKIENFKGIDSLTNQQKEDLSETLRNVEAVLKDLRELQDNVYKIQICEQLENKIISFSPKTPGLAYFFRGSFKESSSRDRHLLGEIYSSPWYYLARYESFQEMYKLIADAYYSILWEGVTPTFEKSEITLLSAQISAQSFYYKDEIIAAIDKSHHLLKMARLIKYKKDNKFNDDVREFCANTEESIIEENDYDYKAAWQELLEIYDIQESEFLTKEERTPIDINFKVNYGWLRPRVRETFNTKKEKIIKTIEKDLN